MNAKIRIVTLTEGRRSVYTAHALVNCSAQKASVSYFQEGDRVTLHLTPAELQMRREGRLRADFIQGKKTVFEILCGGDEGPISIFTKVYTAHFAENVIRAELIYTLDFGNGLQEFHLEIFIQSISEAS